MKFLQSPAVILLLAGLFFSSICAVPIPQLASDTGDSKPAEDTGGNPPPKPAKAPGAQEPSSAGKVTVKPAQIAPVIPPSGILAPTTAIPPGVPVPVECGVSCQLQHQTTIIILICILVCIILLIVILFGCYFLKKLHGKALLTADNADIIRRLPPKKTTLKHLDPVEYVQKTTETMSVPGANPNETKLITKTTTQIVSKSVDDLDEFA